MRFIKRVPWMVIGGVIAYLFDPKSGRTRRDRLQSRAMARLRDYLDILGKRARYEAGRAKGMVYETLDTGRLPSDDEELLQKVRSEAVGRTPGNVDHVEVGVDNGVVYLRGVSEDPTTEHELEGRIRDVRGVREIRNQLIPA